MFRVNTLRQWNPAAAVSGLICPPECLWCKIPMGPGHVFCSRCYHRIVSDYYRCKTCATPIPQVVPNEDCHKCRESRWRFDRVITLGPYRSDLREAVILMKKPRQEALRRGVGTLMAQLLTDERNMEDCEPTTPCVIPVPNYWTHGFQGAADSAGTLARTVARQTECPLATGIIRRIRKTAKQGMLSWSERTENVRRAFKITSAEKLLGRHVILVDDVLTSGATASELAGRLKKAGATSVTVLVAARGTGARESTTISPNSNKATR